MIYASRNLSLALVEIIVHLEVPAEQLPPDYVKIAIAVPDGIELDCMHELPRTAREMVEAGMRWLESGSTAGLLVPSVIIPEEQNLLLNPTHYDFVKIKAVSKPFEFDPRLFAQG